MPKGTRCPFQLTPPVEEDTDEREKTLSFKQPIDPDQPNGIKLVHTAKICDSTYIEDILKHELQFARLQFQNESKHNCRKESGLRSNTFTFLADCMAASMHRTSR